MGVPSSVTDPGIAFPFGALTERPGPFQVEAFDYEGSPAVVVWSDVAQGGMAYRPLADTGDAVTLRATATGLEDDESGSQWTVDGRAVSGPMEGARLVAIEQTYTAYWGAWAAFHPTTRLSL